MDVKDFITRFTYHSNAIEGNTLTMQETYDLLYHHSYSKYMNQREIYEAINHKKILDILLDKVKNKELLSHELLILINQTINENIMYVGGYRLGPIRIIGSQKKFPYPMELEERMSNFIDNYNNLIHNNINMLDIAKMHLQYENIHPFPDGNGRTGRLLVNYLLLIKNQCPIVIPVSKRAEYLEYMEECNVEALAHFFVELQKDEQERNLYLNTAYLKNEKNYTIFTFRQYRLKFLAPNSLERYIKVKEWDHGYIVVDTKYKHNDFIEEEYIDLIPILENLYFDPDVFLEPIKEVKVLYD